MKKLIVLSFIISIFFGYSQPVSGQDVIDFYPIKAVDTIYSLEELQEIKEKYFFYNDEENKNSDLFLCSIKRESERFGENSLSYQKTLIKKFNDFWVVYDFQDYWGSPEKGLMDNTFYILSKTQGNAGSNGEYGNWSWGMNSIFLFDFKNMSISEEIIIDYGLHQRYLEIEEDNSSKSDDEDSFIITEAECSVQYKVENSKLILSDSFCVNETIREKGSKTELVEKTNDDCSCKTDGEYQYSEGKFVKINE